jgi:hypothetical protein
MPKNRKVVARFVSTVDGIEFAGKKSGSALGRLGELISGQKLRTSNVLRTRSSSDGGGCAAHEGVR